MTNEHLSLILNEYRPSMRLDIIVEREKVMETTVLDLMCKLISEPPSSSVHFCGRGDCILRERGEATDDVAGAAPYRTWLEMDMR
jgi:hypothetical protein